MIATTATTTQQQQQALRELHAGLARCAGRLISALASGAAEVAESDEEDGEEVVKNEKNGGIVSCDEPLFGALCEVVRVCEENCW